MWVPVSSTQLHSLQYSPEDSTLDVRFLCGSCHGKGGDCKKCSGWGHSSHYRYAGVPVEKYIAVRDDKESVGKAFHVHIKKGDYKFERVK